MRKIHLFMEGNKIAATWDNFDCLATSPAGFGDNISGAVKDLITNSSVIEVNDVITSIENEPFKERASDTKELAATVPAVAAANKQSDEIKPCSRLSDCAFVRQEGFCCNTKCKVYDPV